MELPMAVKTKTPEPSTQVNKWDEDLAKYAQEASAKEAGGGAFLSFKSGMLSFMGNAIPGNKLEVVVLGDVHENLYYDQPFDPDNALELLETAFAFPIRLIANALGVPPPAMIEMGKAHGVPVAALVGAKEHAIRQVNAGVDILVAQGGEAGGHCGEVSTMVLVPEVMIHGK